MLFSLKPYRAGESSQKDVEFEAFRKSTAAKGETLQPKHMALQRCPFNGSDHAWNNTGVLPAVLEALKTPLQFCFLPLITLSLLRQCLSCLLFISSEQEGTTFFSFTALSPGLSRVPNT